MPTVSPLSQPMPMPQPTGLFQGGAMTEPRPHAGEWTFLTNHTHVLLQLALEPDIRLRDIAAKVGITERAAHAIVSDLVDAGYVTRTRVGRRNRYAVRPTLPLRHPLEADHAIGELLAVLGANLGPGRHREHA